MKLQLLVPQYNENKHIICFLLDSIKHQININFEKDIEVLIGNDGSKTKIGKLFLNKYPFSIKYYKFKHSRLAGCRQKLFNLSTADYVMYCDADDAFTDITALSMILSAISIRNPDIINCPFYEEHHQNDSTYYIPHISDKTFVHGKIYKRSFLADNNVRWHEELYEHQDGCYTGLAFSLTKNVIEFKSPIYLWHDNPNSVVRRNGPNHIINTLYRFIEAQACLTRDYYERDMEIQAVYHAVYIMYYCYYMMMHNLFYTKENEENLLRMYKTVVNYYREFRLLLEKENDKEKTDEIIKAVKDKLQKKYPGRLTKQLPEFEQWMQCLLALY